MALMAQTNYVVVLKTDSDQERPLCAVIMGINTQHVLLFNFEDWLCLYDFITESLDWSKKKSLRTLCIPMQSAPKLLFKWRIKLVYLATITIIIFFYFKDQSHASCFLKMEKNMTIKLKYTGTWKYLCDCMTAGSEERHKSNKRKTFRRLTQQPVM